MPGSSLAAGAAGLRRPASEDPKPKELAQLPAASPRLKRRQNGGAWGGAEGLAVTSEGTPEWRSMTAALFCGKAEGGRGFLVGFSDCLPWPPGAAARPAPPVSPAAVSRLLAAAASPSRADCRFNSPEQQRGCSVPRAGRPIGHRGPIDPCRACPLSKTHLAVAREPLLTVWFMNPTAHRISFNQGRLFFRTHPHHPDGHASLDHFRG